MNSTSEYDNAINLDELMDKMNNNFNMSLKTTLVPFVDKVNLIDGNYRAISETLRKIPEFRDLISENAALKKELAEIKVSYSEYPSVTLKVTEKEGNNEDMNTLVQQVYTDVDGQFLDADESSVGSHDTDGNHGGDGEDENLRDCKVNVVHESGDDGDGDDDAHDSEDDDDAHDSEDDDDAHDSEGDDDAHDSEGDDDAHDRRWRGDDDDMTED